MNVGIRHIRGETLSTPKNSLHPKTIIRIMLQKIIRKYGPGSNIILLGIVSFVTDTSSEMISPLLPLFIIYLGGTGYAIGVIAGIGDSAASILKVFSGYLSDKTGKRKPFVFTGYLVSSISKALYAASVIWQHILVLMTAERIGKGIRAAPRDAIIANSAPLDRMGWAFGVHRTMDSAGAIFGTILTIGILSYVMFFEPGFDGVYQCVFIIAGIIAFFGLIPLRWVREDDVAHDSRSMRASFTALPGSFRIYLAITTIFALGNFTYMFFILRASDVLLEGGTGGASGAAQTGLNLTTETLIMVSALYMLFNITYTLFSIPGGNLSDKIGRRNVLTIGYLLFGITCIGFARLDSVAELIILFALYGVFKAMVDGTQRAYASDFVEPNLRGTALGAFHTMIGVATLPASIIAGALWEYAPDATFVYGGAIGFLAAGLFVVAGRMGLDKKRFFHKKSSKNCPSGGGW